MRLLTSAVVEVPGPVTVRLEVSRRGSDPPVETVVERQGETHCGHGAAAHGGGEEGQEVSVVEVTDTSVDPGTVVVHLHHTPGTPPAVVGPGSLVTRALRAELELGAVLRVVWSPVGREVARAYTEGAQEMVESQTGETGEEEGVDQTEQTLRRRPQHGGAVKRG